MLSGTFSGIKVMADPFMPKTRNEQFRFPRSKRVRIQKKWRKEKHNWHEVDATGDMYLLGNLGCGLIHPDGYARLRAGIINIGKVFDR